MLQAILKKCLQRLKVLQAILKNACNSLKMLQAFKENAYNTLKVLQAREKCLQHFFLAIYSHLHYSVCAFCHKCCKHVKKMLATPIFSYL